MKIMIDAGHGLNTPGKRTPDGSLIEFNFNNPTAHYVQNLLQDYRDVTVRFSHDPTGRIDVPLSTRADIANRWGADLFVSIHANAFGNSWNGAEGIETFIYTNPTQRERAIAKEIQSALIERTDRVNRGVKQADFAVLRETNMTAVLVECGFMTNREEAALLKTQEYRLQCARGIVAGIVSHYNLQMKSIASMSKTMREEKRLYQPSNQEIYESTRTVLARLEGKVPNGISKQWREQLENGELSLDDAIGILYVALARGLIVGPERES